MGVSRGVPECGLLQSPYIETLVRQQFRPNRRRRQQGAETGLDDKVW